MARVDPGVVGAPGVHLEFERVGRAVVVVGRLRGKGAGSGIDVDAPLAQVCRVRDGRVARMISYPDRETALAAARSAG